MAIRMVLGVKFYPSHTHIKLTLLNSLPLLLTLSKHTRTDAQAKFCADVFSFLIDSIASTFNISMLVSIMEIFGIARALRTPS